MYGEEQQLSGVETPDLATRSRTGLLSPSDRGLLTVYSSVCPRTSILSAGSLLLLLSPQPRQHLLWPAQYGSATAQPPQIAIRRVISPNPTPGILMAERRPFTPDGLLSSGAILTPRPGHPHRVRLTDRLRHRRRPRSHHRRRPLRPSAAHRPPRPAPSVELDARPSDPRRSSRRREARGAPGPLGEDTGAAATPPQPTGRPRRTAVTPKTGRS